MPAELLAQAETLEGQKQSVSDCSEYPLLAKSTVNVQVEALRNYALVIQQVGEVPQKRPGMTGEERRERRVAILRLRAARLQVKAANGFRHSHDIGSRIPFGQPIIVGH